MFHQHQGEAILEWVVLGAVVIAVVGAVVYTITNSSKTQGLAAADQISKIAAPTAHP